MQAEKGTRVKLIKPLREDTVPVGTTGTIVATWLGGFTVKWDGGNPTPYAFDTGTGSRKLEVVDNEEVGNGGA